MTTKQLETVREMRRAKMRAMWVRGDKVKVIAEAMCVCVAAVYKNALVHRWPERGSEKPEPVE